MADERRHGANTHGVCNSLQLVRLTGRNVCKMIKPKCEMCFVTGIVHVNRGNKLHTWENTYDCKNPDCDIYIFPIGTLKTGGSK